MVAERRPESADRGIRTGEEALLSSALEAIHELNGRCLAILQQLAAKQPGSLPRFLAPLAPRLRELDSASMAGIADQPFLLVDFAFGMPQVLGELLAGGAAPSLFRSPRGALPAADAAPLARGALILAKAVCRHHPAHAGLLLGLEPSLQIPIAQLRLPDLERLAEGHPHLLRLRWENRPEIWRRLLSLPISADPGASDGFRLYGMQLMAGDLAQNVRGSR